MHVIDLKHATSTGHRIPGHQGGQGKCARLHGHTYAYAISLSAEVLDETGFVLDFGVVKAVLDEWDHRTLLWADDPLYLEMLGAPSFSESNKLEEAAGVVRVPFVPTSENMAEYLAHKFIREFEQVVHCNVEVWESQASCARFYADRYSLSIVDRLPESVSP